jgi:hypothetical protein
MIAPLAKFIDWSVLQIANAILPQSMWREPVVEIQPGHRRTIHLSGRKKDPEAVAAAMLETAG